MFVVGGAIALILTGGAEAFSALRGARPLIRAGHLRRGGVIMASDSLGVGVIGAGRIGQVHLETIAGWVAWAARDSTCRHPPAPSLTRTPCTHTHTRERAHNDR